MGQKLIIGLMMMAAAVHANAWTADAAKNLLAAVTGDNIATSSPAEPGAVQTAFSPDGGAEKLVIKVIRSAKESLQVAAYSFTSKEIAGELLAASKRGVKVYVVADKSQIGEKYTAVKFLANQGVPVRIDREHAIQHSKYIVADGRTVQTGSYNYTSSARERNAENVLVIWNKADLAKRYQEDWMRHWEHAEPISAAY